MIRPAEPGSELLGRFLYVEPIRFMKRNLPRLLSLSALLGACACSSNAAAIDGFTDIPTAAEARPEPVSSPTALPGLKAPKSIRVQLVADSPQTVHPVGLAFEATGDAHVIEWRPSPKLQHSTEEVTFQDGTRTTLSRWSKDSRDVFRRLYDANQDGVCKTSETVLGDLTLPSAVVMHDAWWYFAVPGRIVRIEPTLKATGQKGTIKQDVVRGIGGVEPLPISSLAFSPDNWLYFTVGPGDHRLEGSDGSRAIVMRTGAIFRCRPDGSDIHEVARGLRSPRGIAFDPLFNLLAVDGDPEANSAFPGLRLLHVQEGNDFGWRLKSDATAVVSDPIRTTLQGDRPGTTAPIALLPGASASGCAFVYGDHLPAWLNGSMVFIDDARRAVRGARLQRSGATFKAVEQFDLLSAADDPDFQPAAVVYGPDGAIYVVDRRARLSTTEAVLTGPEQGRIYRLTNAANKVPPSPPAVRRELSGVKDIVLSRAKDKDTSNLWIEKWIEALVKRGATQPDRLWTIHQLESALLPVLPQVRDANELAKALQLDKLDDGQLGTLFAALCNRRYDAATQLLLVEYSTRDSDIGRIATELFIRNATLETTLPNADTQIARLNFGIKSTSPELRRTSASALSKIGQLYRQRDAEQIRQITATLTTTLLQERPANSRTFEGLVRAVERLGEPAIRQLSMHVTQRRSRSAATAVIAIESMRSRPAARILDGILFSDIAHLNADQQRSLVRAYRAIQVDPPVSLSTLAAYLVASEDATPEVRLDGLKTLIAGLNDSNREELAEPIQTLATALLKSQNPVIRQQVEQLMTAVKTAAQ